MVCENFDKVVVLVNSSSAMELGFLDASGVDAALWIGGPGSTGLKAVAQALAGTVNPSGRLPDTYAYDLTSSPAYYNAGDFTYTGSTHEAAGLIATLTGATTEDYKFVNYVEGIYVGYRFYETAAADGFIDYETTVQYPFGYGLSYTTFDQQMGELKALTVRSPWMSPSPTPALSPARRLSSSTTLHPTPRAASKKPMWCSAPLTRPSC